MKKQNKITRFMNSKGFYTALFTCLFGVLAIAAVVSVRNIDALNKLAVQENVVSSEPPAEIGGELAATGQQKDTPVAQLEKERQETQFTTETAEEATVAPLESDGDALAKAKVNIKEVNDDPTAQPKSNDANSKAAPTKSDENSAPAERQNPDAQAAADANAGAAESAPEGLKGGPEKDASPTAHAAPAEAETLEEVTGFVPFAEGDTMSWPLDGAVVMDYSADKMVYDKTLDQYRTNPSICISAEVGTQVKAAADGVVKSLSTDPRSGNTVVIDHGNGWTSKYAQLQDTILVQEGQQVHAGQALGGVGDPTKYSVLLGPHLDFAIDKDSAPQNPQLVLANEPSSVTH